MSEQEGHSPRQFLKSRRPSRFSDSVFREERGLDRSLLEYHLDTLTNRSQEKDFEVFCREIVKREICPNILPQTGPTGGGDSKVDSETYPVAPDLTLSWLVGSPESASSERWAFAFSAAEQWRSKVRDDIDKIADVDRGYTKAFFISSQFIRDKARGDLEDELRERHDLDVRVLDRTWLLDRVFSGGHEAIAIDTLHIQVPHESKIQLGPEDYRKKSDLEELESSIEEKTHQQRFTPQLADDALNAAILSRQLEKPRQEIEGQFERAERTAQKCGTPHQLLKVAYEKVWTTFWWFEDYAAFNDLYRRAEKRALGSHNIRDLELLTNLWTLLATILRRDELSSEALNWEKRTERLKSELERLRAERSRPSTSLWAQSLLLGMELLTTPPDEIDDLLEEFEEVILKAEGLIGFPLETLLQILEELGDAMGGREAYDELYETIIQVSSHREGEVSTARMLLRRGKQHLDENPYNAIRFFGRSLSRLYKHESRHDLVRSLYWCASAYEQVGLLWAARGSLLFAASVATTELYRYGDINLQQYLCLMQLRRIELRLGRMGYALAWHDAAEAIASALVEQGHDEEPFLRDLETFDRLYGAQLLRVDFRVLRRLEKLPDALLTLGLPLSYTALLYSLGHEVDLDLKELPHVDNTHEYFLSWRNGLAGEESPPKPRLYNRRKIELESTILGCKIRAKVVNNRSAIAFAESLLASLESFLATGPVDKIGAREPEMTMQIQTSEFARDPFSFELEDQEGRPHLSVRLKTKDLQTLTLEEQDRITEEMIELIARVTTRITMVGDPEVLIRKLCVDERGVERAIHFTTSLVTTQNVLGENWKYRASSFGSDDLERYELRRDTPWDAGNPMPDISRKYALENLELADPETPPPDDLTNPKQIKHSNIEIDNLIRPALWDEAAWFGMAFLTDRFGSLPPIMAPIFEDLDTAEKIFSLLRQEIGEIDEEDELRVTIVRGIDRTRPQDYKVIFRPKTVRPMTKKRFGTLMTRIHTMEPTSEENLERFLSSYEKAGRYILAPATAQSRQGGLPPRVSRLSIRKQDLHVRKAYEIGIRDPDSVAIQENDNPVIPNGINDAPVLSLISQPDSPD